VAAKEIRFRYDPAGTPVDHDFYAADVRVEWELDASEYTYLNNSSEVDVRKIRPVFVVTGVLETTNSSSKTFGQILLDLLKSTTTIRFFPDKSNSAVYSNVVPDVSHRSTLMAMKLGIINKSVELHLKQASWNDPADAILNDFAQLIPTMSG